MKIIKTLNGLIVTPGISLEDDDDAIDSNDLPGLEPIKGGKPRGFYVYFHHDHDGNIFYVGKGTARRAWSKDRHHLWNKYVTERLGGKYEVEIYRDSLDEYAAEALEAELIGEYGEQLVNWFGRHLDIIALERYNKLYDKNRRFVADTRPFEKTDPEKAIERYHKALVAMREYEAITFEKGLVAELGRGEGRGDYNILDRLTLTLVRLGRHAEAIDEAERYVADFPSVLKLASAKKIVKRVDKAREKLKST